MKKGSLFKKVWDFEKLYALYFQILICVNNSSDLGVFKAFGYCCRLRNVLLQKYTISETLSFSLIN